jgi:glycosyltransferase involved in cell wall biosynthesis
MQTENGRLSGGMRLKGKFAEGSADRPLVTVVTSILNGRPYVAGCLESVLRQDYPNIEHIVFDGASNDGTVDVLREFDDRIALWRSEPDTGVYDAWNKALVEARGEWICFLGADDEFQPGAISAYMALANRNPQAEYLCSRVNWVHSSGYRRIIGEPWRWRKFLKTTCVPHTGSMHRRSLLDKLGAFDTSYPLLADYEILMRAGRQLNTAYMPIITVMMRGGGQSSTYGFRAFEEEARAQVETGGRNKTLATIHKYVQKAKFSLRPIRFALGRTIARVK